VITRFCPRDRQSGARAADAAVWNPSGYFYDACDQVKVYVQLNGSLLIFALLSAQAMVGENSPFASYPWGLYKRRQPPMYELSRGPDYCSAAPE